MQDIYLKQIFTDRTIIYSIQANDSMATIIENLKIWIMRDFQLDNVEIVEAGQNVDQGQRAEDAPALISDESTTFAQKYGNILYQVAFYIRPIETDTIDCNCVLCYPENVNIETTCYYGCTHYICSICVNQSRANNLLRCPICRHAPIVG